MLRLFLQNQEVELNESVQFAITKQFEDITNPTSIINDWSKTVKIPSTAKNDKLFGHIYNVDRLTVFGDHKLMGIYFDPYKKIDFRLQWGDAIVMTGYAKNISVDKDSYNITLNGELGKVFQEMKKITFDKTSEDTEYIINGEKYVNQVIKKELLKDIWSVEAGKDQTLREVTDRAYNIEEIIGFAPNNAFDEEFDYKTYQVNDSLSETFEQELNDKAASVLGGEKTYADATGITAEAVVRDGLTPREIGEYRSYLQQPYIFFNKLFQIFTTKAQEITGYQMELDNTWFNEVNPYWTNLVCMMKKLGVDKSGDSQNNYAFNGSDANWTSNFSTIKSYSLTPTLINEKAPRYDASTNTFKYKENDYIYNEVSILMDLTGYIANNVGTIYLNEDNCLIIDIVFRGALSVSKKIVVYRSGTANESVLDQVHSADASLAIGTPSSNIGSSYGQGWKVSIGVKDIGFVYATMGEDVTVDISSGWLNNNNPIGAGTASTNVYAVLKQVSLISTIRQDYKRSYSTFTLNDLWDKEYNLFDVILNYCKQFRIGVFCDYFNKKIVFKPLSKFFKDYTVEDWTDKVDFSQDYHIEPITFQNKYVLFNYQNNEVELNKAYKEKIGVNYGEYKLSTNYEFNNESTELFEHSRTAIPSTDSVLSWGSLYSDFEIIYTLPAEVIVNNKDKENKSLNIFGSLLFYRGLANFDTTSGLRNVVVSDDTHLQQTRNIYFYTQDVEGYSMPVTTYPHLDITYLDNLSTYVAPMENYTYQKEIGTNGVFNNFWKQYLDERYNIQNKIVTCHIHLSPQDYINFSFNKFIKINNQLYFVNKIYDYSIDTDTPTKVDLITIQDIKGYTDNNFRIFEVYYENEVFDPQFHYIRLEHAGDGATLYVTSNTDIQAYAKNQEFHSLEVNGVDIA